MYSTLNSSYLIVFGFALSILPWVIMITLASYDKTKPSQKLGTILSSVSLVGSFLLIVIFGYDTLELKPNTIKSTVHEHPHYEECIKDELNKINYRDYVLKNSDLRDAIKTCSKKAKKQAIKEELL